MDDNERCKTLDISLRDLPCSKWRRRTRACSLAVMRGVLATSMSTSVCGGVCQAACFGDQTAATHPLMRVDNLTCMDPPDR